MGKPKKKKKFVLAKTEIFSLNLELENKILIWALDKYLNKR